MAGPKKSTPVPVDKGMAKAYLREFRGMSTAYPPGLSDPTSLRIMENVSITREGAAQIRPALRSVLPENVWLDANFAAHMVGGFEHFFLNDGRKALLFATRLQSGVVGFKVAVYNSTTKRFDVLELAAPGVEFEIPQGESELNFTQATTFVKYLQIDNKIFALSDGGEDLRLFNVGETKRARKITPIEEPLWQSDRTLTVVHPTAAWINDPVKETVPTAQTPTTETLINNRKLNVTTASGQPFTTTSPHKLTIGTEVTLRGTTAPTGFTLGTKYFVRGVPAENQFTVSTTANGAVLNPTSAGAGLYFELTGLNEFNYGFFYTFENEIGESAASQTKIIQASRGWSQWRFFAPDADGNKSETNVTDPKMAMDQLVAFMPETVFNQALIESAIKWNLYMFTWSNQDAVPVEGVLVGSKELGPGSTYQKDGWIQCTAAIDISTSAAMLPTENNRYNYSDPSSASQGLVAGDRLVLVNDRKNGALIRWSSNQTGEYTNFTPTKGGGFKTLTSGNLYIPASVKLWQNPQSVDTITILCSGVDGYSTSYYMAPADVSGQTSSAAIMAFEETTATPGTTSPYGVEVLNNALYHPLDTELMKSTASNYNINHATMSSDIANRWAALKNKDHIISSQHDNRLYYLVQNPDGEDLIEGCNGNEVWVYDAAQDAGTWSRWTVQGISLSKLEIDGQLYLAISRPEGIFVFDENKVTDDTSAIGGTVQRAIKWKLVTNTQGANRAHDAWALVKQANVTLGNFRGSMRYGIRGHIRQGEPVEIAKIYHSLERGPYLPLARIDPFDIDDYMIVDRDLKEWYFFAESIEESGEVAPSSGQINYVQYLFTPLSINTNSNFGSVETFEYGRDTGHWGSNTFNGVPVPFIDSVRP